MSRILNTILSPYRSFDLGNFLLQQEVDSQEQPQASIMVKADAQTLLITEVVIEGDLGKLPLPTIGMTTKEFQQLAESYEWSNALRWVFTHHDPNLNARYVGFLANNGQEATE